MHTPSSLSLARLRVCVDVNACWAEPALDSRYYLTCWAGRDACDLYRQLAVVAGVV